MTLPIDAQPRPKTRQIRDGLFASMLPAATHDNAEAPVRIRRSAEPIPYGVALAYMDKQVQSIINGNTAEQVWLLEHPPVYTAGTRANPQDLLEPDRFPVHKTGRGGEYTYHGPGQRIAYVMLDLNRRSRDIRCYVAALEDWIIATLKTIGVTGERRDDRVGVWVRRPDKPPLADGTMAEDKIAAIGVRIRKWVTFHGISVNVYPQLSHYDGIVPCGIAGHGVTSLHNLGIDITMDRFDAALMENFEPAFGPAEPIIQPA
ncbi:MAG: lipoyl(octanoyl) transferase LipB [Alphaproteobacteria bacterium]